MEYKLTYTSEFDRHEYASFNVNIKMGEANFKYHIFGSAGEKIFPLKTRINKWLKAIVADETINNVFCFESDDGADYYEKLQIGIKNDLFVIDNLQIPYKLIKSDLINFLTEFRNLTDSKKELIKFKNTLEELDDDKFPIIKTIEGTTYYFSSEENYEEMDFTKEWIEKLQEFCNSDITRINLDSYNELYIEGDSVRSHHDYKVGCGLTEGWKFWGKYHDKFRDNLLKELVHV